MKLLRSDLLAAAKSRPAGYLAEVLAKCKSSEGEILTIDDGDWLYLRLKYQGRSPNDLELPPLYRELRRKP